MYQGLRGPLSADNVRPSQARRWMTSTCTPNDTGVHLLKDPSLNCPLLGLCMLNLMQPTEMVAQLCNLISNLRQTLRARSSQWQYQFEHTRFNLWWRQDAQKARQNSMKIWLKRGKISRWLMAMVKSEGLEWCPWNIYKIYFRRPCVYWLLHCLRRSQNKGNNRTTALQFPIGQKVVKLQLGRKVCKLHHATRKSRIYIMTLHEDLSAINAH